jgi:hypothetical protein
MERAVLQLRDAGCFCAGLDGYGIWGGSGLLSVPAHEGETGFEDSVGCEDTEAHGGQGGADEHNQVYEVLHTTPVVQFRYSGDPTFQKSPHLKVYMGTPGLLRMPFSCPALGFSQRIHAR